MSSQNLNTDFLSFNNDPTNLRIYTLENGLKVYLSKNTDTPKIETLIAVKAGSTYDPEDNTGLAHYLEHMMFKGTSKIGTSDWNKEKKLLDQIEELYEQHKNETNLEQRVKIYKQIDSISYEASKYAVANEYDKMISSLGAEGTNAFTSNEMTVYKNTIPTNELNKWLRVEKERFGEVTLRLFHTELETVYEEFNRGQDNDQRKHFTALMEALFPTHPYGTKTTIGTAEHLKSPSITAIKSYFNKYYVPNNMAMILVGDLDYEETIKNIQSTFGQLKAKEVTHPSFTENTLIDTPVEKTVYGPSQASVYVGYRTQGYTSAEALKIQLIDYLLANSTTGLIDLNLNTKVKVQSATSFTSFKNDYGIHILKGLPKKGQSLEEVRDLLLSQIELIQKGDFEEWMLEAIINDMKLNELKSFESIKSTAFEYLYSFIYNQNWNDRLTKIERLKQISKQDIVDFANQFYGENYVFIKKEIGEDVNQVKVDNPKITPVEINRDSISSFVRDFNKIKSESLNPEFIDFNEKIKNYNFKTGIEYQSIENVTNELATLIYRFPIGRDHDKFLPVAFSYINYIGSQKLSNELIKKEFYKLAVSYSFKVNKDEVIIYFNGLNENLHEASNLLFETLNSLEPSAVALDNLISKILKQRSNTLQDKSAILWKGLLNYSKYGENSRLRNTITHDDYEVLQPIELINKIQQVIKYEPKVFYYGQNSKQFLKQLDKDYTNTDFKETLPDQIKFVEQEAKGQVYFVDFDMVQTELVFLSKKEIFDPSLRAKIALFNTYFGGGLSSIVFQELRESQSLAYSVRTKYSNASEQGNPNYLFSYIGTQSNKLSQAVNAIQDLLNEMPLNELQFNSAKASLIKSISAERYTKDHIYWEKERLQKMGITSDTRVSICKEIESLTLNDLNDFFKNYVKNVPFDVLFIGNKKDIDFESLSGLGELQELDPKYLFNY